MENAVFFDVDCLEAFDKNSVSVRPIFEKMGFRPRVKPIAEKLNALYGKIVEYDKKLLFCTCCSGNMPEIADFPEFFFVRRKGGQADLSGVDSKRVIYIEKKTTGVPAENYSLCCFDPFGHNENLNRVVDYISEENWVVFGNGFDLCVMSVIRGLLKKGKRVTFVEDLIIRGARGYGNLGTEEFWDDSIAELKNSGVSFISYENLMSEFGK